MILNNKRYYIIKSLLILLFLISVNVSSENLLFESFKSPAGDNSWSTELTGGAFNWGQTNKFGMTPSGELVYSNGVNDARIYITWPVTAQDSARVSFGFILDSTTLQNGNVIQWGRTGGNTSTSVVRYNIRNSNGSIQISFDYRSNSTYAATTYQTINIGQRYWIQHDYCRSGARFDAWIGPYHVANNVSLTNPDRNQQFSEIGGESGQNTGDQKIWFHVENYTVVDSSSYIDSVVTPASTPQCSLFVKTRNGGTSTTTPSGWVTFTNCGTDSQLITANAANGYTHVQWLKSSDSVTISSPNTTSTYVKCRSKTGRYDTLIAVFCSNGFTCTPPVLLSGATHPIGNGHNSLGKNKVVTVGNTLIMHDLNGSYSVLCFSTDNGQSWVRNDSEITYSQSIIVDTANNIYTFHINNNNLFYKKFRTSNLTGTSIPGYQIATLGACELDAYRHPSCAIDSKNNVYVASNGGNPDRILIYTTTNGGTNWNGPYCPSPIPGSINGWYHPTITALPSDTMIVSFQNVGNELPPTLFFGYSANSGQTWDTTRTVVSGSNARYPDIINIGKSGIMMFAQLQDTTIKGPYSRFRASLLAPWSPWKLIFNNPRTGYGDPVGVASSNGDTIIVVCRKERPTGTFFDNVVYMSNDTGNTWRIVDSNFVQADTTCAFKFGIEQPRRNTSVTFKWVWGNWINGKGLHYYFDQNSLIKLSYYKAKSTVNSVKTIKPKTPRGYGYRKSY